MFTFSLQTVLEVRERLEKIKYKEFSTELMERQRLEGLIQTNQESLTGSGEKFDQVRRMTGIAASFQIHQNYRTRLQAEIGLLRGQLREQEQALEGKRKELVEARRAHKALEILRDKERERYNREQTRRERMVMDEVASNYHVYKH